MNLLHSCAIGLVEMIQLPIFVLTFFSSVSAQATGDSSSVGRFFNPANPTSIPSSDFSRNVVWTIGEIQQIQWTTVFRDYTIALWQQSLVKGAATKGPAIFQTENGALAQFNWIVDDFGFDLKESNVFFLWLHDGPYSQNGNTSVLSTTSRFFNITDEPLKPTASSSTPTLTSVTSSRTLSTVKEDSTSTKKDSSSTSVSANPISSQTLASSTLSAGPNESASNNNNNSGGSGTGSQIGIGIGVGIGCVSAALAAYFVFWCMRRRAKARSHGGGEEHPAPQKQNPVEMESALDRPVRELHIENPHRRGVAELM